MSEFAVVTTAELIACLQKQPTTIEAGLILSCCGRSTHFLRYYEKGTKKLIYDTGCDSKSRRVTRAQFLRDYPDARWEIRSYHLH